MANLEIVSDILERIERYEQGIKRHQNAQNPSRLAISQYEEMRDEMISFLLDYIVELGGKNVLKNYASKLELSIAA